MFSLKKEKRPSNWLWRHFLMAYITCVKIMKSLIQFLLFFWLAAEVFSWDILKLYHSWVTHCLIWLCLDISMEPCGNKIRRAFLCFLGSGRLCWNQALCSDSPWTTDTLFMHPTEKTLWETEFWVSEEVCWLCWIIAMPASPLVL